MRICVTTWYDEGFSALGDLCLLSLARYCRVQGYELQIPEVPHSNRPPAWNKIQVCLALFDQGADFVLWVDADAVMVRTDVDVLSELADGEDIGIVADRNGERCFPNSGVMILRNCEWTRTFLEDVWNSEKYIDHIWWENAAVMDLLGYHSSLDENRSDEPDQDRLAHVRWLDSKWNLLVGVNHADHPVIKHYAGSKYARRYANMRADLDQAAPLEHPQPWKVLKYKLRRRFLGR